MTAFEDYNQELILDGTKISWHRDRLEKWRNGERFAPITIDMALTRSCNFACEYCYATLQENKRKRMSKEIISNFLDDCKEIGVKGISLVSDGESTLSPFFEHTIVKGSKLGISMAVGTNGYLLNKKLIKNIVSHLTYIRINITAGEPKRYSEIMGVKESWFEEVKNNIRALVIAKRKSNSSITIGLQMVLKPEYADQIIPLTKLGKELEVDYLVIKHCSDDEDGSLGVNYDGYQRIYPLLKEAESYSTSKYQVQAKWSKISSKGLRSYSKCFGPPFILQISGSGLVAPCGMLFNEKYKKFHIGNICEQRFRDIVFSDKYWDVMNYLSSKHFDAKKMCGSLCLQHKVNEFLNTEIASSSPLLEPIGPPPEHLNFI